MLSRNLKFINFKNEKKQNLINKKLKKIEIDKFTDKYPVLKSFSKKYKYSYKTKDIKKLKKFQNYNLLGMGGSILGSEAIYQFLNKKIKKKFTFINNLNSQLNLKKKGLNIIISKSGNTLETISNFHVLQKYKLAKKNIFITEKKDSYLKILANKLKDEVFEHRNYIGGRYSILSEVGMLPAELMGLNPMKFKRFDDLIKNKSS